MKISECFNSTSTKSLAKADANGQPNISLRGAIHVPDENPVLIGSIQGQYINCWIAWLK